MGGKNLDYHFPNKNNNLNLVSLRQIHKEFDTIEIADKQNTPNKIEENDETKEYTLTLPDGSNFIIPIQRNGMVNATLLCQAGGKLFKDYVKNKQTELYLEALKSDRRILPTELIIVKKKLFNKDSKNHNQALQNHHMFSPFIYINVVLQSTGFGGRLFFVDNLFVRQQRKDGFHFYTTVL